MIPDDYDVVIDDSDKELFIMFKAIADKGLPHLSEATTNVIRMMLFKKKRKLRFKVYEQEGKVYVDFPRWTPFHYIMSYLKYWYLLLTKKKDEDRDDDTSLRQVV